MKDFDDPWRYRCPREHSNWRAGRGDTYYCYSCGEAFDELVDAKAAADTDEQPTPIRDDPALDDIDDRAERAVVALFDLEQTHLGG